MFTILIADDEKKVGTLVKELIDWEKLPLKLLDIVQDGKEAYEFIMERSPDIVITDIRMPIISGLELIQKVSESGIEVHFIVISGYRYFEYAQKALKYGVEDYLLKPIDEKELNQILAKVCEKELARKKENIRVESMQKSISNSKYVLHRELINSMFKQESVTPMEEINKDYGVNLDSGIFRGVHIKVDRNIQIDRNEHQEKLIMQKLTELVKKEFEGKVIDIVFSVQNYMGILILLNYEENRRGDIQESIHRLFLNVKDYINDFKNYDITVGISKESADFSNINILLGMAKEAVNCRIYLGSGKRIETYSEDRNKDVKAYDICKKYEGKLDKAVSIMDGIMAAEYVRNCMNESIDEKIMACEFYELVKEVVESFCEKVKKIFGEEMGDKSNIWQETANHCKSVVMLENYLSGVFRNYLTELNEKRKALEIKPVQETVEYMKKNYKQKILMEEMAEHFGFNANYFSEIFKNETGKNFSVYLIEVRMEAAKTLLRDTNDAIYEIASKVGYKDAKFFSQQFAKVVGIKPNEYRKLYY